MGKEVLSVYRISELADKVGLSRSTLLYCEKQGLLHGTRQANGYRLFSPRCWVEARCALGINRPTN